MADQNVKLGGLNINGISVIEVKPPTAKNSGDAFQKGEQTISRIARGITTGTGIEYTNKKVNHICDISLSVKFDVLSAKSTLRQLLQDARDAIMSLFSGDAFSPIITQLKQLAKWIAAKIKALSKIIKAIAEVAKIAKEIYEAVTKIIAWIQSLPELIARALAACLASFNKLLSTAVGIVTGAITTSVDSITKAVTDLTKTATAQVEDIADKANSLSGTAPNLPTILKPIV